MGPAKASGSGDNGSIKLWPKEGRGEPVVRWHCARGWSLVVLPDGRLASGAADDSSRSKLWLVGELKLIAVLCLCAGSNLTKDEWVRYIVANTSW